MESFYTKPRLPVCSIYPNQVQQQIPIEDNLLRHVPAVVDGERQMNYGAIVPQLVEEELKESHALVEPSHYIQESDSDFPSLTPPQIRRTGRGKLISTRTVNDVARGDAIHGRKTTAPSGKPQFKRGLNKIVGGMDAGKGEIKYQISFQDTSYLIPFHFCGGSVYTETWMITAAHCVAGEDFENPQNLQIVAGDYTLKEDEGTEQAVAVSKIIQHEDYNAFTVNNDIALLQIASALTFDDSVAAIGLPSQGQDSTGDGTVTGWGTLTEGGTTPTVLQKVDVPIVTDDVCRDAYGESDIADSMICAGLAEGGKDSCQGDSGGPMVCNSSTGRTYLCGVVSWGYGCARPDYPGVYTEVSYFVDWIMANAA